VLGKEQYVANEVGVGDLRRCCGFTVGVVPVAAFVIGLAGRFVLPLLLRLPSPFQSVSI